MQIQLNGETQEVADELTLERLIGVLELEPSRVAIELNRNVVRRHDWAATTLHDGDRVEIVHFVGGGADVSRQRSDIRGFLLIRIGACESVHYFLIKDLMRSTNSEEMIRPLTSDF